MFTLLCQTNALQRRSLHTNPLDRRPHDNFITMR